MKHFTRNSFELIRHLLASALAALIALGPAQLAFADPHGFDPGKSGAKMSQTGNTTVVTAPNKSIIHWQSFNVGKNEVVRFENNTDVGMIRVLNRIDKSAPTRIDGAITQQAQPGVNQTFMIYIVNPAGVFFGSDARINVTGLQAVAGNLSDSDFKRGADHFTNLKGKVENAARPSAENPDAGIIADAVSLVGRSVANSGTIDADSWIVLAAGRDVFIGKDPNGNGGLLLRVEGGADAVFNKSAVGVTNTGELIADGLPTPDQPKLVPRISLGAGDLYGTAIFNTGAIKAREVALRASNKGDVALAGEVRADTLNVTFAGDKSGKLVGANNDPEHVLNANTINLRAVGEKGQVVVDDAFSLRNQVGNDNTGHLNVEQRAVMETSNLAKLGLGLPGDRKDTEVALKSAQGIDMDDKALVRGTQLTLDAPAVLIHGDSDPLVVERLALQARLTRSESDLVVLGEDKRVESNDANGVALPTTWDPALRIGGNLELTTKPRPAGTEQRPAVIEVKQGTISTVGDIVTSDGGPLRIEAADVKLGVVSADGTNLSGGSILSSGTVPSSVTIVANNVGLDPHLKGGVTAKSLITRAAVLAPGVEQTKGGNVDVSAVGDLHLFGDVLTEGGAGLRATDPRKDGGSVHLTSGGTLTVANITTGGGDVHGPGSAEVGNILLHGDKLVLNGNLNALAGSTKNESGQRNRSIRLEGPVTLGSDNPLIGGGAVTVTGKITEGLKRTDAADPNSALIQRDSELFFDTGALRLEGGADLKSLSIVTHGEPSVLFGGDVTADEFVDVGFSTNGVGHWGTTGSDPVKVTADLISVSTEPSLPGGSIELGDNLRFKLTAPKDPPTDPDNPRPTFSLFQTSAIDEDTTNNLFIPGRFVDGVAGSTLRFTTSAAIQFAESALDDVKGSDLELFGESFSVGPHSAPRLAFDVDSFVLTTQRALTVDFDVIARGTRDIQNHTEDQGIAIQSGQGGTGNLVVNGKLQSRAVLLVAGDGIAATNPDGTEVGTGVDATVTIGAGASFSNAADTAAPLVFGIAQDAALSSTALPSPSQFRGGSIDNMQLRLESFEAGVSLDPAHPEQYKNSKLVLKGATIDLGDQPLELSGLDAKSRGALDVDHAITVSDPNGAIDLTAGDRTGVGDLSVTAPLTADFIDLSAGILDGTATTSRVQLELPAGAKFAGGSQVSPKHFGLTQDASLDSGDLPTRADFANPNIDGMSLALRSKGGRLDVTDTDLIHDTALELEGKTAVTVKLDGHGIVFKSLDVNGPTTLDGSVRSEGNLEIDGTLTLNAPALSPDPNSPAVPTDQLILADGALTITGATSKTTGGSVGIGSTAPSQNVGGAVVIGDVSTAHTGGRIQILGNTTVKTGVLDASGTRPAPVPNQLADVFVQGKQSVEVAGIKTTGAVGAAGADGGRGGNVEVKGASLRLGTVDASGGRGGSPNRDRDSTNGGEAGSISLTANGGTPTIGILGDLLAAGGQGATSDADVPLGPLRGAGNAVSVTGDLLLLANREIGTGATNTIRGSTVAISGNVKPGTDAEGKLIDAGATGLTVVADDSLTIGGTAITAGRLDLEVHNANLDLGEKTIHSDTIRLAASNGADDDPNGTGEVDLSGLEFMGSNGTRRIVSLTVEQDKGFGGPNGSEIPDVAHFLGTSEPKELERSLALISQDGAIVLDQTDFDNVEGTRLTLAANKPIAISGDELKLQRLQLGSVVGVGLSKVGGDATVNGDLTLTGIGLDDETLRAYGNLTVNGDATVKGRSTFTSEIPGHENQRFDVTGELEFGGSELGKTTTGSLNLTAGDGITLKAPIAQTISNGGGQLLIGAPLKKGEFANDPDGNPAPVPELIDPMKPSLGFAVGQRSLSLIGVSPSAGQPAVVVTGAQQITPGSRQYAIAVANGNVVISASSGSTGNRTGSYQLGGDVLAFGDVTLSGEGTFKGGAQPQYTVEALRNPLELAGLLSGELTMGGVASADHDLRLVATGDNPSEEIEHPAGIHLLGNFTNLEGALEVDGDVDFKDDTTIAAAGDVTFDRRVQGEKGLSVTSNGQVVLGDDVAMSAGALSLSGDGGVRFASTSDTQFVQAGSISLGAGAARAPSGVATLVRDGNLSLKASGGDVAVAKGQRLVVNGSLDVSAPKRIALTDTAALRISLVSHDLIVSSGATVMANSIVAAARPRVTGNGLATFAVPTRTELSDNIPSDDILVRQINADGSPLSLSGAFETFPTVPFPEVNGPAQFDYARQTPPPPVRLPLSRPHVDEAELDASLADRPLWAEELLAYLEERSLETPGGSAAVEHLPPVGARPGDPITPEDQRVRSAAAEQAVTLYREVFRPKVARDPETGFIDGPGRAAAIRAAFQAPIDVLRRENGGRPVSGSALRELIASNPSFASAASYGSQIDQLLAAGELALTPDQKPRFRALLLSEVTPYGIAPAEFETAIQ